MALYLQNNGLNNLEAIQAVAVMKIGVVAKLGERLEDNVLIADGDIIGIGSLPPKCNVRDITLNIFGDYPTGTTIDLVYTDKIGKTTGFIDLALGLTVENSNQTMIVPLPLGNTINPDGSPSMSDGNLQSGKDGVEIFAIFHEGDRPLKQDDIGNLGINFSYSYFGNRSTGGYTS